MHLRIILACMGCCLALLPQSTPPGPAPDLHKLFEDYHEFTLSESPEKATLAGRTDYNSRWSDYSPRATERRRKTLLEFRSRLQSIRNVLDNKTNSAVNCSTTRHNSH
jgi:hypothetical protein